MLPAESRRRDFEQCEVVRDNWPLNGCKNPLGNKEEHKPKKKKKKKK
jgi:hypothetical protein